MVVLDTDHLTLLERTESELTQRLRTHLDAIDESEITTTIVSYEEQTRGWMSFMARCGRAEQLIEPYRRLHRQLKAYCGMTVLDFDDRAAREFARLQALHLRIGTFDLRIAAIALANDALLLLRNLRDFQKIPGLDVEDWTVAR